MTRFPCGHDRTPDNTYRRPDRRESPKCLACQREKWRLYNDRHLAKPRRKPYSDLLARVW